MFKKLRAALGERKAHNDMDFECVYWWGDRAGSVIGVTNERCEACR